MVIDEGRGKNLQSPFRRLMYSMPLCCRQCSEVSNESLILRVVSCGVSTAPLRIGKQEESKKKSSEIRLPKKIDASSLE